VISSSQKPLPENVVSQQTNIHASGGIRTRNLGKRAAADPRLRPRGNWDRFKHTTILHKSYVVVIGLHQAIQCAVCILQGIVCDFGNGSLQELFQSWARRIQSTYSYPIYLTSVLILSSYLCLGVPTCLFPSGFPTKTPCPHLLSPIRATCPAYLILLDLITRITFAEQYRSYISPLYSLLHSPVIPSLLDRNIFFLCPTLEHLNYKNSKKITFTPVCDQNLVIYVKPLAHAVPLMWAIKFHTHINNRQHYGYSLSVIRLKVGKQQILDRLIASIPRIESALSVLGSRF